MLARLDNAKPLTHDGQHEQADRAEDRAKVIQLLCEGMSGFCLKSSKKATG
jgi:hypothetical protein